MNSLSKKPVWDDLSFVTWCIILLEVVIRRWYTVVIKDGHGQQQYSGRLWHLNNAQLVLMDPKCVKKISSTPLHHQHQQPEPLRQGRMDPCFHVLYAEFWPYYLNVAAEIKTHQTRQRFSNLLLSNFGNLLTQITTRYNQGMKNTISERTTHRTLKQMGSSSRRPHRVPLLSDKNRTRRIQFTQAHQNLTIED